MAWPEAGAISSTAAATQPRRNCYVNAAPQLPQNFEPGSFAAWH